MFLKNLCFSVVICFNETDCFHANFTLSEIFYDKKQIFDKFIFYLDLIYCDFIGMALLGHHSNLIELL